TQHRIDVMAGGVASVVLHWALKTAFAFAACRALADSARTGTLELLFTTQLSPGRLVSGHIWGLVRSFGLPTAVVIAGTFCGRRSGDWNRARCGQNVARDHHRG